MQRLKANPETLIVHSATDSPCERVRPSALSGLCNQTEAQYRVGEPQSQALGRLHGSTPPEARLAEAAAAVMKVTQCPVRSRLERVLFTTGGCRRRDLVRILLSDLVPMI